jgi:Protein of unknown function (DUF2442)
MSTFVNNDGNNFDALEKLIFSNNLRIKSLDIRPELNIMNVTLNTGFVIRTNISSFPSLKKATKAKILNYKLIGNGTGIHWPSLDEDLSLKGFLKDELLRVVKPSSVVAG